MADRFHSALLTNPPVDACKTNPPPSQMVFYPKVDNTVLSEKMAFFYPSRPPTALAVADPDSTKKNESDIAISIDKRRPFKELKRDQSRGTYERQVSYFSETSARLQREKSARLQKYYQTELSRCYRYSYGSLVETVHQPPESGSVTALDYSPDGLHLAQGFGNGLVKILKNDSNLTTTIDTRRSPTRGGDRVTKVKLFGTRHLFLAFCNRKGRVYLGRYYTETHDMGEFESDCHEEQKIRYTAHDNDELDESVGDVSGEVRRASKLDEYAFSSRSVRLKNKLVPDDSADVRRRILSKEKEEWNKLETIHDKQKKLFDPPEKEVLWKCHLFVKERHEIEALDVNLNSSCLVTGGQDATVRLYDINMGKVIKEYSSHKRDCFLTQSSHGVDGTIDTEGHFLRIHALRFSDASVNIFASGGLDGVVKIWDTRAPNAVRNLVGPMICGDSLDIMEYRLLCGQWTCRTSLELFDLRNFTSRPVVPTNRKIGTLSEYPYCCKFLRGWGKCQGVEFASGDLIASGHANCLEICSVSEKKIVKAFPSEGNVLSVTNYMQTVVTGTSDHTLSFYSFLPNEYAAVHVLNIKDFDPAVEDDEEDEMYLAGVTPAMTDLNALWSAKYGDLWAATNKDDEFVKYVEKVKRVMKAAACDGVTRDGVEIDRKSLLKNEEAGVFSVLPEEWGEGGGNSASSTAMADDGGEAKKSAADRLLSDIDPKRLDDLSDRKFVKKMKVKLSDERSRLADAKLVKEIDNALQEEMDESDDILEFAEKPRTSDLEPYKAEFGAKKKKQVSIMGRDLKE